MSKVRCIAQTIIQRPNEKFKFRSFWAKIEKNLSCFQHPAIKYKYGLFIFDTGKFYAN